MRLHRMISILLLVEAKGKVKAKELAEELETSVRTVYRDIDSLCEAGVPLVTDTGPNGGIHFVEGYKVGIKNMQPDEIVSIYLGGMGVKPDKNSDMAMKINSALLKLQKNLPSELNEDLNKVKKRFYVDDAPWWEQQADSLESIDCIMEALWRNRKLQITYRKQNGDTSKRNIRPYGIVVKHMEWYLIGYCEKNNDIRTFKCERIIQGKALDETFVLPTNFSIEEFWLKNRQKFIAECQRREQYPVTIRLDKCNASILNDYKVYKRAENEECIEAVINMYEYEFAANEILKFITRIEILEPVELRSLAQQRLKNMLKKYDKNYT